MALYLYRNDYNDYMLYSRIVVKITKNWLAMNYIVHKSILVFVLYLTQTLRLHTQFHSTSCIPSPPPPLKKRGGRGSVQNINRRVNINNQSTKRL